ncbi:MAG: endonuclease domain-containing protein [Oscillospiraceae bacterium]|nr:endonuclease domain-containing protein [Oscillospiraceae bacterium]
MNDRNNQHLTNNAQSLRKTMTKEERHLWYDCLKNLPLTINRQKVIGRYIVDFYCAEKSIVIELDGSQHYEGPGLESDQVRDSYLQSKGIRVLRYANSDISRNFDGVCQDIRIHLGLEE